MYQVTIEIHREHGMSYKKYFMTDDELDQFYRLTEGNKRLIVCAIDSVQVWTAKEILYHLEKREENSK